MSKEGEAGTRAPPKPFKTWADEVDEADDGGYVLAAEPITALEADEAAGPKQQDSHGCQPYGWPHAHSSSTDRQAPAPWTPAGRAGYSSSSYQQQPQPPVDHQQNYSGWSPAGRMCSVTVSNLPLEADQQEIAAAFRRGAGVQVQHVRHRPTPAEPWVVVEFADPRDLQAALQAPPGSITLAGRPLVLQVPHPAESWHPGGQVARGPRSSDNWRSTGSSGSTVQPPTPAQRGPASGGGNEGSDAEPQQRVQSKKSDPFGGAKPVDTAAVYLDGHPHHAAAAEARMGSLPHEPQPHVSIRDAHLAHEPQALHSGALNQEQQLTEQQQLQPPVPPRQPLPGVRLLQRPQTLQQQQQPQQHLLAQQQPVQQQAVWTAPGGPYAQFPPSELPVHAQQPPPMPVHRGFVHVMPAGLGVPPAAFHAGHVPPPPPPPPPPPARPLPPAAAVAAGVVQQVQGSGDAAAPGPGLQGQWVYRQAAPLGFRPLAAGSSRASGTGSAGSSRRGSIAALSDIAPQEQSARQDPSGLYVQAREVPYQQAGVPAHQGMYSAAPAAGYPVAALAAERTQAAQAAPAAVEDDAGWGKVEELLKRESQQGEEQGGEIQLTEAGTAQEQAACRNSWGAAPAAQQNADGWGDAPSTAPDAAGLDSWGAAALAAPDQPAGRPAGVDSWGAAAPAAPDEPAASSAGLDSWGAAGPAALDEPAVPSTGSDAAAGGLQSSSSGSFPSSRGRGRGFGPRASHHSAYATSRYDDSRGRGRGRGRGRRVSSGEVAAAERQHSVPQTASSSSGIAAAEAADASAAASAAVADMQPAAARADGHSSSDVSRSSSHRGRGAGRGDRGDRARRDAAASSATGAPGRKSRDGEPAPATAADAGGTSAHTAGEQEGRGRRKQQPRGSGPKHGGRSSHASSAAVLPSEDSWGDVQAEATDSAQLPPSHRGRGRGRGGRGAADASHAAAGVDGRGFGRGRGQRRASADANGHAQVGAESGPEVVQQQRASKAGATSRKPADGSGAVVQRAALNPAFEPSKGEKLYQVLSAKDKQKKQGAKLENPFDLLSQLADD